MYIYVYQVIKNWGPGLYNSLYHADKENIGPENIGTLYLLSALKEPVHIDCKEVCSAMEQAWISTFCWHICWKYL